MLNVTVVAVAPIVAVAVVVCVPINTPSVRNVCACPFTSVVKVVGSTDPPPDAAAHVTVTPATALPFASLTSTTWGVWSRVATGPVRLSPELFTSVAAAPAVPVAVKVSGLPVSVPDVTVRVFGPAVGPNVQEVTAVIPFAPVATGVVGLTVPEPDATANVTLTPATGFPFASRTITDGAISTAVPAVAVWPLPALMAICVAAPAVPVAVKVTGLPVSPVDVAVSEFGPAVGPKVHEVTSAIPLAFAVTGVVGVTQPPPDATANVTVTPATGLPVASCAITDGVTSTAVPAVAAWPSPALMAIWLAPPAAPVAGKVTGLPLIPLPAALAVSVSGPAVVESVQLPTVAMPLASVVWLAPVTLPLPGATANVTGTPATGLPLASRTITDGREATALPAVAACGVMLLLVIAAAAPAVTVTVAVCVIATEPIVAETVFNPAAVERSV